MELHVASGAAGSTRRLSRAATFWISLIATCIVILLPTTIVSLTVRLTEWTPHPAAMWVSTAVMSLAILMCGTHWWMRQPGSTTMSFGELMLWRWVRRRRADEVVHEGTRLLDPAEVRTRSGQLEMLRALNAALEVRDPYTRGHSRRVERHAYRTALAMHRSVEDIFNLRVAASLHDIGKIEVPIEVIRKQGPLDNREWVLMKSHPAAGAQMIENIGHQALVRAVRHHHERWDGKGYPDGLAGEDIPLHARIIAVCDTFDAITSTRSYRSKSSRDTAIEIIKKNSGTQFDPDVVQAFLAALPRGAPGVAALSWLSLPALQKGLSQATLMFREAGIAGVAGAIATGGLAGTVATTAVNPSKYLNRPAIVRSQAHEQAAHTAKERAAVNGVVVLGTSVAKADADASRATTRNSVGSVSAAQPGQRKADASGRKNERGSRDRERGRDASGSQRPSEAHGQAKKNDPSVVAATTGGSNAPDDKKDTTEPTQATPTDVVEDTTSSSSAPPGRAKKNEPPADDDPIEVTEDVTSNEPDEAASRTNGKGKSK